MKTLTKKLQVVGNIGLVQFGTLEDEGFGFKPAGPAIEKGNLIIKEARAEGTVSKLLAINETTDYLLLTDMDILKGAKQNRVINVSVLLAPMSKTEMDVSCVERLRWDYTSPDFKISDEGMDLDMRSAKASSLKSEAQGSFEEENVQSRMWNMVSSKMSAMGFSNATEDYEQFLRKGRKRKWSERRIVADKLCNGLAVFMDGQIMSVDLFGNRNVYAYYFPKLSDAVKRNANMEEKKIDQAEAFYRLDEFLDNLQFVELPENKTIQGAGSLMMIKQENIPGFRLSFKNQEVHLAAFIKIA